jgi:PKD repeat protein
MVTKRQILCGVIPGILLLVLMIMPVSAGLSVTDGDPITTRTGETSEVITIIDSDLPMDGTITIDVEPLQYGVVASGVFTDANVVVSDTAAAATWTGVVEGDTLTLTSTEGDTVMGETVTVTFTGANGSPWMQDTGGDWPFELPATRTDTGDAATLRFTIVTTLDTVGSLTAEVGEAITSTEGNTTVVLTVSGTPISRYDGIIVDISPLHPYVSSGMFTSDNIEVDDTAAAATWTGTLVGDTLRLSADDGMTEVGETILVTFTGAGGNPWVPDTQSLPPATLYLVREDNYAMAEFTLDIDLAVPPGFTIEGGAPVTATDGNTTFVITIADTEVLLDGAITIDIAPLQGSEGVLVNGTLENDNVLISDTATNATWTYTVVGDTLTLTSTEGNTTVGETIALTFSGSEGNPWIPNTYGVKTISLTATRSDIPSPVRFDFIIETAPPPDYVVAANFTSFSTVGGAPFTVTFTDQSLGHPTVWNWEFGDGETSADQSPTHTFASAGTYSVSLNVSNAYGWDALTKENYVHIGEVSTASTTIAGLTIVNSTGIQTVSVDTTLLAAMVRSNNSILEFDLPADQGFSRIIFYALNGTSFSTEGNTISGQIRGVRMISEDIAPTGGFSTLIGREASFGYSIDLPAYPTNAAISTMIWEGEISSFNDKLLYVTLAQGATPIGTAYTASIIGTNFPPNATVIIRMSVDAGWSQNLPNGPAPVFIWRIADDGYSGQVFNTTLLSIDPMSNLAHFEANCIDLSTFGLSALGGNNSPYGLISWAVKQAAASTSGSDNAGGSDSSDTTISAGVSGGGGTTSSEVPTTSPSNDVSTYVPTETMEKTEVVAVTPVPTTLAVAPILVPSGTGSLAFLMQNPVMIAAVVIILVIIIVLESKLHVLRRKEHKYLDATPDGGASALEGLLETDQQKALTGIIDVLNDVDTQLKVLDKNMMKRAPGFMFETAEADTIVEKFFYTCQVVEEKIKSAAAEEHISHKQIDHLNGQLKDAVDRMIAVSQKSPVLAQAVQLRMGTGTAAAGGET